MRRLSDGSKLEQASFSSPTARSFRFSMLTAIFLHDLPSVLSVVVLYVIRIDISLGNNVSGGASSARLTVHKADENN